MNTLAVEYRKVEALIPYARNAKQHTDAQVAQIAASIREFGWGAPILVDGKNNVIAGHGRLLAARKLGMDEVPVVPMSHLTDTQRRALILADNKIGENASWDDELLGLELTELRELGFNLDLTGFSPEEWDALINGDEAKDGLTDDDAVPEVPETPVSKTGDVWVLGEHKLLCGDATKAPDYAALLGDELVDMSFTDPPYNVNYANTRGHGPVCALLSTQRDHQGPARRVGWYGPAPGALLRQRGQGLAEPSGGLRVARG